MRNNILLIATGAQGIGKSYTSLKHAIYQAYVAKHKRSTLIFDTNLNEYESKVIDGVTHRIQKINHNDIIRFSNYHVPEVRRISPVHSNGMIMSSDEVEKLLLYVMTYLRNSTLIIEDTNKIFGDNLPQSIASLLCNVRHRGLDTILHLQSMGRVLPKHRQNTAIFRYHYQWDSIAESEDKLKGDAEIIFLAEKMVNKKVAEGDERFFIYVYREIKKLKGRFSPRMLSEAIQEYLSENERIIRPLLVKRDNKGKKIYNYEQSLKIKTVELFNKYWGN